MNINYPNTMTKEEAQGYVDYLQDKYQRSLSELSIEIDKDDPDYVGLNYRFSSLPFERIRRITGYLVGTMDQWNNAKTAEESDRVKHGVGSPVMEQL